MVVDPDDYEAVLGELRSDGRLSATTRLQLAGKAFTHTAAYEAAIAGWFDAGAGPDELGLPAVIRLELERAETLRYGENPHQQGARYRVRGTSGFFDGVAQRSGPALELPEPDGRRSGLAPGARPR